MSGITKFSEYTNRRVTVMGLGLFGGGVAAAKFLANQGARVTVTDLRSGNDLSSSLHELHGIPIHHFELGQHLHEHFTECDLLVVNPAVKPGNKFVELSRQSGAETTTELGLFLDHNRSRVIAVTGSNGKSTTASMIYHILNDLGAACHLGGNIGGSLLPKLAEIQESHWTVLEISSFQLALMNENQVAPEIAVVTNFSPNHLDWHETIEEYRSAKQSLLRQQQANDVVILNGDDADVRSWKGPAERILFSVDDAFPEDCLPEYLANATAYRADVSAALKVAIALQLDPTEAMQSLKNFPGLPHRMELVATINQRLFVNDSASTTPESTIAALNSAVKPPLLIFGGSTKGATLDALALEIGERCRAVALIGETGKHIQSLIDSDAFRNSYIHWHDNLEAAVRGLFARSAPGDTILLSPGSASFGMFQNFEARGERFRKIVDRIQSEHET